MTDRIEYTVAEGIAEILLNLPPVNALGLDAIERLIALLRKASEDDDVRAVIIGSALPKRFCAGLNLDEMLGYDGPRIHKAVSKFYVELTEVQFNLGKPSIAAIRGAARGAGMTLGITCDVIVAGENASFGYPEIDVGLIPGIHYVHLPRIIGRHNAFELLFTGRTFGAAEAKTMGLVNRIAADDDVLPAARVLARQFASKSPEIMRLARAAFMRAIDLDYRSGVANVVEAFCNIANTPDSREGIAAFAEKRTPNWRK